ncbi:hypothetical protein PI124_g11136 [Phytophthora idaei]|nr:hypothetical protein PI125_g10647 [Phytophthora idaei]KAG3244067.1 hypothetical protein PI124_g11136 [Phytophthora idaei]
MEALCVGSGKFACGSSCPGAEEPLFDRREPFSAARSWQRAVVASSGNNKRQQWTVVGSVESRVA